MEEGGLWGPASLRLAGAAAAGAASAVLAWYLWAWPQPGKGGHGTTANRPQVAQGLLGLVGRTPLVRIKSLSEATGCEVSIHTDPLQIFLNISHDVLASLPAAAPISAWGCSGASLLA